MKRSGWSSLILSCTALPLAIGGGTPLLEKNERKALHEAMTNYQQAFVDKNSEKKAMKALPKLYADLKKALEDVAKKKKIDSMMKSPADLRLLFAVPIRPEASPKKDAYYDMEKRFKVGQTDEKLKYFLRVPKAYVPGEPTPVVLVLHPPIKRADEVKKWVTAAIPTSVTDRAIVIVPLNVDNPTDWNSELGHIRAIHPLKPTLDALWVDRSRIDVFGAGESAGSAIDYVTFFPGIFAGAIVSHPTAALPNKKLATARYIPMMCLSAGAGDGSQAAKDSSQLTTSFVEEVKKAGGMASETSCVVDATGALDAAGQEAFGKFVTDTIKDVAPKKVTLVTDSDACQNAYWFRIDNVDVEKDAVASMEAEINGNEIRVTTPPSVRGFHVYLNDELVDMGKTIKVVHVVQGKDEAKVVFEGTKTPSLDKAIDLWIGAAHGNFAEAYTNVIDVTIAP